MPKIIHTGDLHLDSPFGGLPNNEAKARRASLREVFSKIVDIANNENVDILILAGDIFDGYPIHPETETAFLRDLKRAKCRVFITPGNHDPLTPNAPYSTLTFPENVHIFSSETLSSIEIPELSTRIFGAAYKSDVYDGRILDDFTVPNDDFANIVILHSNLYTDGYSPVSVNEIAECGADYVALAHVHKPTSVEKAGAVSYAYCGCPEARDFGECYDTAIYIGEVEKGKVSLTRKKVSDVCFREVSIDASALSDISAQLPTPMPKEFLRLTVLGECEYLDSESLANELLTRYAEVEISDRTTPPRDIWEGLSDDGLRGVFLRKMKARLDTAENDEEKEKILLATRLGIDAIENREM